MHRSFISLMNAVKLKDRENKIWIQSRLAYRHIKSKYGNNTIGCQVNKIFVDL